MNEDTYTENKYIAPLLRITALRRKYQADIAIAKAELENYLTDSVGVAEHPHIIESMDLLMTQLSNAEEKLRSLEENF
tara:strand:+ start:332 stop:565 length:234 start_codon:yes stop_codon:yes gene_type:complete